MASLSAASMSALKAINVYSRLCCFGGNLSQRNVNRRAGSYEEEEEEVKSESVIIGESVAAVVKPPRGINCQATPAHHSKEIKCRAININAGCGTPPLWHACET